MPVAVSMAWSIVIFFNIWELNCENPHARNTCITVLPGILHVYTLSFHQDTSPTPAKNIDRRSNEQGADQLLKMKTARPR